MSTIRLLCVLLALSACDNGKERKIPQVLSEKEADIMIAKFNVLDKRECAILMQARLDLLPVEIERSVIVGVPKSDAIQMEKESFNIDREMCLKNGISPYIKRPIDEEAERHGMDASDIRAK